MIVGPACGGSGRAPDAAADLRDATLAVGRAYGLAVAQADAAVRAFGMAWRRLRNKDLPPFR